MTDERWDPTTPQALTELRHLGLITEAEARRLASARKGPQRGMRLCQSGGVWYVFNGTRWVPCADDEEAITLSQQWLDEARAGQQK